MSLFVLQYAAIEMRIQQARWGGGGLWISLLFFSQITIYLLLFRTKTKFNSLSSLLDLAFPLLQQRMCKAPIYWFMLLL
jgi:hypothetical protein